MYRTVRLGHYLLFHSTDFISHLIATKFLLRLNHKLESLVTFSGNNFSHMDTVLFKFQPFAFQSEVCKMGEHFYLQNGLELLCRLWPCGPRPKQTHVWAQLEDSYDFQNLWLLFRKCDFIKIS